MTGKKVTSIRFERFIFKLPLLVGVIGFNALADRYMDRYGLADEASLANLLKMHAEEVFGYQDYESALQSLFI